MDAEWLAERYDWIAASEEPLEPDYDKMDKGEAEKIEDMKKARAESYGDEEAKAILVTAEEQEVFDEHAGNLQCHPAVRRQTYTERLQAIIGAQESLPGAKKKAAAAAAGKALKAKEKEQKKSLKIRVAKQNANAEWLKRGLQYMRKVTHSSC